MDSANVPQSTAPTPLRSHTQTNGHMVDPVAISSPLPSRTSTNEIRTTLTTSSLGYSVVPPPYLPGGSRSLPGISIRAFYLGIALGLCFNLSLLLLYVDATDQHWSLLQYRTQSEVHAAQYAFHNTADGYYSVGYLWRIPFFIATLALFHYLEFDMTARFNTADAQVSSFLLFNNGWAYTVAHLTAIFECFFRWLAHSPYKPAMLSLNLSWLPDSWPSLMEKLSLSNLTLSLPSIEAFPSIPGYVFIALGVVLVALGQLLRSLAMRTAGKSFNHIVQSTRKNDHVLVTDGVYSWSRHPSYLGFFWWGLGTQLVLGNHFCFVAYAALLWKFFETRISHEERHLNYFFGKAYAEYKKKTPVLIPFIR